MTQFKDGGLVRTEYGGLVVLDLPGLQAKQQTDFARTLIVSGFLVRLPG